MRRTLLLFLTCAVFAQAPRETAAIQRLPEWGRIRTAATPLLGWRVGITAASFPQLSLAEAASRAASASATIIIGEDTQKLSPDIPKNVDYRLMPGERTAVVERFRAGGVKMPAYRVSRIGPTEADARKVFEFAKAVAVETLVSSPDLALLPMLDALAAEHGINLAIQHSSASAWITALQTRSKRIGAWLDAASATPEQVALLKDRPLIIAFRGSTAASLTPIARELYRLNIKALIIADAAGAADPNTELLSALDHMEKAVTPVMADRVAQFAKTQATRGPGRITPEDRQKLEAALPESAAAKPKKPRKLLVVDLNVAYGGHRSIPHANLVLELMGKRTGAFEAVFSNDLDNLKYENLRQYDALYLNNTVGMLFPDSDVRAGVLRFVREGGGIGGNHGSTHASMDWPEFGEMIGAISGAHREPTERATVRIEDPATPLTAGFEGKEFLHEDEFFRFSPASPYSRDNLRVLMSIDVAKTDMNQGRGCGGCTRPDHDYAVSWIRSYGKGRVFYCTLGHNPTMFLDPRLARFFLAGVQFILGDLEADTTPSAKLPRK
jgi:hypothetical protein